MNTVVGYGLLYGFIAGFWFGWWAIVLFHYYEVLKETGGSFLLFMALFIVACVGSLYIIL